VQQAFRVRVSDVCERSVDAARRSPTPRVLRVLILSGGAQHGAFGAGILRVWRPQQPQLDIVTGISTGSLQATAAFLGSEARLADLEQAYTTVSEDDVIERRWWFRLPFSNSLVTTAGLRELIERYISDAVIDEVAAHAERHGGILAVGTTDLDTGEFVVWDLTAAARAKEYELYRLVILASSSMPVMMEPVLIGDALHVDGGVREQLFVRDLRDAMARARADTRLDATVIVNGGLCAHPARTENCLLPIAFRTLDLVLTEAAVGNLYKTQTILQEMQQRGASEYRLAAIPADFTAVPESEFDNRYMSALFARGKQFAERGEWGAELIPTCPEGRRRQ
jgi:predicted acylesterase/phospholipase RssA